VPVRKWLVIARNEYRIRTSGIRKIRPYFPALAIMLLVVLVGFVAPLTAKAVFGLFHDEFEAFFVSIAAVAMMQLFLFMFFFFFITYPINFAMKDVGTEEYEIFLSAPVKPSDVLLGKFMGALPLYAIAIAAITGFFAAFLIPLGIGIIEIMIIIAVFVLTFLSAIWIGSLIAALLRSKLGRTSRGKDIGKALPLIIVLPIIALMYAIMGGGLTQALADPGTSGAVETVMNILPSSWGAGIIALFAHSAISPTGVPNLWFDVLIRFGALVLFFLATLWLGERVANRAYSLEATSFTAARAKPDGTFYRFVRSIGGGKSFGTLLVSIFKDYGRRFENISKIIYIVGLLVLISVFFGMDREDPADALVQGIFLFPFLAAFVVGEVTVRGKESLFLYRKAPGGEGALVKARLLQGCLVVLPIATVFAVISLVLVPQITLLELLAFTGLLILIVAAYVAFSLGLFLLMPVFTDKPAELMANVMIVMITSIVLFIVCTIIMEGFLGALLLLTLMIWVLGIIFLYLGKRNLSRIE